MGGKAVVWTRFSVLPASLSEELSVPLLKATPFCYHILSSQHAVTLQCFSIALCLVRGVSCRMANFLLYAEEAASAAF